MNIITAAACLALLVLCHSVATATESTTDNITKAIEKELPSLRSDDVSTVANRITSFVNRRMNTTPFIQQNTRLDISVLPCLAIAGNGSDTSVNIRYSYGLLLACTGSINDTKALYNRIQQAHPTTIITSNANKDRGLIAAFLYCPSTGPAAIDGATSVVSGLCAGIKELPDLDPTTVTSVVAMVDEFLVVVDPYQASEETTGSTRSRLSANAFSKHPFIDTFYQIVRKFDISRSFSVIGDT